MLSLLLVATLAAAPVAWVGATLVDGTGAPPVPDAVVVVDGDRIVAAGPRASVKIPRRALVEDVSGHWITPGLVDAHVHFFQSGGVATRPDIADLREVRPYTAEVQRIRASLPDTFRRTLAAGVTAVVDDGGPYWNFEVRDLARSTPQAPRVAVAGPLLSTVERPQLDLGDPPILKMSTPEDARAEVRRQAARQPDFIKIWFIPDKEQGIAPAVPMVQAAIQEAHALDLRVAVHATGLAEARAAVDLGADILVHSVDDQPVDPSFLDLMRTRGTLYVPTLLVVERYAQVFSGRVQAVEMEVRLGDPVVMGSWSEFSVLAPGRVPPEKTAARVARAAAIAPTLEANLRAVAGAGIPVAAGTDAGNVGTLHGASLHAELQRMEAWGLSPMQVLVAATRDAARVFDATPDFGTVEKGRLADLLVLDADPLAHVANLQRIDRVVKGGQVFRPDALVPPNPAWVVDRQVDAYNARDLELFLSFYAPDARLFRLQTGQDVAAGTEAIRQVYGELFTASPTLRCDVMAREISGPLVVDHELVQGLRGGPPVRAVAIYEVKDGRIQRVWMGGRE